jgi:Bacterial Ig-like domain
VKNQINNSEVEPAALEIKGAKTMNNLIRNSLTITAFTALALVFGACSQPTADQPTDQSLPDKTTAIEISADTGSDTSATAADLADVNAVDPAANSSEQLQAQGGDKVPPVLTYFYPSDGGYGYYYSCIYLDFSEKMKHDTVKKALKVVVTPLSGASYKPKGTWYWYYYSSTQHETAYFCPNNYLPSGALVNWKIGRDAKDLVGNKLFAGKNASFQVY